MDNNKAIDVLIDDLKQGAAPYKAKDNIYIYTSKAPCFIGRIIQGGFYIRTCEALAPELDALLRGRSVEWLLSYDFLQALSSLLLKVGLGLDELKLYFLFDPACQRDKALYEGQDEALTLEVLQGSDIKKRQDLKRFSEAFLFDPSCPDEVGILAIKEGQVIAAAGATRDYASLWQIGIDVEKAHRGNHLGVLLTNALAKLVLTQGAAPFYGTAFSHLASQRVALAAGFLPAYTEISSRKISSLQT